MSTRKISVCFAFFSILIYCSFYLSYFHAEDIITLNEFSTESENLNVCFVDNFHQNKDSESHGDKVVRVFEEYNIRENVNIIKLDYKNYGFQYLSSIDVVDSLFVKKILHDCDFINYSMGSTNRDASYLGPILEFLKDYKGVLSVAAGNKDLTYERSEFSALRKENKVSPWNNKLFIVSQGKIFKKGEMPISKEMLIVNTSNGTAVDFVVDYSVSKLDEKENYKGSSFSTPVVTAFLVAESQKNSFLEKNELNLSSNINRLRNRNFEDRFHIYKTISPQ